MYTSSHPPSLPRPCSTTAYSPSVNSPLAFGWLSGYEACRTGWDRFSKPGNSRIQKSGSPAPLIEFGKDHYENGREGAQKQQPRLALPENWPWSHIITPNSDGTTEVASEKILGKTLHIIVFVSAGGGGGGLKVMC